MREAFIVGVHTTKFGRYPDVGIKEARGPGRARRPPDAALATDALGSVWFSNSGWGMQKFQHCIRGQVALRPLGIEAIPITNVENACAGGSTALHGAWKDVMSGLCDVSLALGVEKTHQTNRYAVFAGFLAGTDVEQAADEAARLLDEIPVATAPRARKAGKKRPTTLASRVKDLRDQAVVGIELGEAMGYDALRKLLAVGRGGGKGKRANGGDHSPFMDIYAHKAREHMRRHGSTARQLAVIAAKNHWHSSMNPNAQYTFVLTPEEVLADRDVAAPLTRSMCAPIGDGAAAAIVMSGDAVRKFGLSARAVRIRASILGSGRNRGADEPGQSASASRASLYERADIGVRDVDFVELHDATAFGELHQTEALGFFPKGEGGLRAERGETRLGGSLSRSIPPAASSRGHPIGASGLAQIHELVTQLRGEAGARQVAKARIGLAENGGGAVGDEEAAMCIHVP